jgi:predicted double-glycine peptidase
MRRIWITVGVALPLLLGKPALAMDLSMPGVAHFGVNVKSMRAMRFTTTLRQQYDFSCGSAALATLLTYHYGKPVTEAAIFQQMFIDGDRPKIRQEGFSLLDMQRYLARLKLKADGFALPIEKLIESRLPAIVLLSENGYNHFVVVKGGDANRVLLGDPSHGTRAMALTRFKEIWPNKLLFVIHQYSGTVTFNGNADWRAAPAAPMSDVVDRSLLTNLSLPRHGPGEF